MPPLCVFNCVSDDEIEIWRFFLRSEEKKKKKLDQREKERERGLKPLVTSVVIHDREPQDAGGSSLQCVQASTFETEQ